MSEKLKGRKIVLTGATRGIGLCIARLFLEEGAEIIGTGKDPNRLAHATKELSAIGPFEGIAVDLGKTGFEKTITDAVAKKWGSLDILFNNAGIMLAYAGFLDDTPGVLENTMQVNLYAPYHLTRALVPYLIRGNEPRVINTSSGAGSFEALHAHDIASYRVSKLALNGFNIVLADELKGKIAVNSFDPGWVKTDLGGSQAPGTPEESAIGALALAIKPFDETGKFWKDGNEIPY
jgi:NAD(P)-dependent dehydrogenase (short-subunit alcohol dehydrogenase family)